MEVRAKCTRIVPHAITESVTGIVADNAVHLRVPQGTGLIEAGSRTVLAAEPYRRGRMVVASLGQWFEPGLTEMPSLATRWASIPRSNLPIETGEQRQLPLLANVVRWLTKPRPDEEELQDLRKPLVDALAASLRVQFDVAPRESLKAPLQKMIDEAQPGIWKEEALWTAGEASLRWAYGIETGPLGPIYSFRTVEGPPQPVPEYYQRLIDEFPQSPLRPLAQWRLAECLRRKAVANRFKVSRQVDLGGGLESISAFEKVDSPKGTYPWAWSRLWIGALRGYNAKYAEAVAPLREVAETMSTSPEKSMALVDLGVLLLGEKADLNEAARYCQAARDAPENIWWVSFYNGWGPFKFGRGERNVSLHTTAELELGAIRNATKQ